MLRFSQRLDELRERANWTQVELARRCGVHPGNVSRWCRGQAFPDRAAMGTLIGVFEESAAADLLVAWIADSLPPGADALVSVKPRKLSSRVAETPVGDDWPPGLNAKTRRKFVDFSNLAMSNPDVMEIVNVLIPRRCGRTGGRARGGAPQEWQIAFGHLRRAPVPIRQRKAGGSESTAPWGERRWEATLRRFRIVRFEGTREIVRYRLEAILAVGFQGVPGVPGPWTA